MPSVPQVYQQQSQPQETSQDPTLAARRSNLPTLSQALPQQVQPLDPRQLIPSTSEVPALPSAYIPPALLFNE